jgi:hypothetical protein
MSNCVVLEISVVIAVRGRTKGNRYLSRTNLIAGIPRSIFIQPIRYFSPTGSQPLQETIYKAATATHPHNDDPKVYFRVVFLYQTRIKSLSIGQREPHRRYSFDAITLEMV